MRRTPLPTRRRRAGQSFAELVLTLPLLLGVIALILEGTLVMSSSQTLSEAVHQAARVAARDGLDSAAIRARIEVVLEDEPLVDAGALRVRVTKDLDASGGDLLRVAAALPVRPLLFTNTASFELTADATYRVPRPEAGGAT